MWRLSGWTKRAFIKQVCFPQTLFPAIFLNPMEKSHCFLSREPAAYFLVNTSSLHRSISNHLITELNHLLYTLNNQVTYFSDILVTQHPALKSVVMLHIIKCVCTGSLCCTLSHRWFPAWRNTELLTGSSHGFYGPVIVVFLWWLRW